jgi:DNA polymerase I
MLDCFVYREIWAVDFEFTAPDGGWPGPVCMVALELRSGRCIRLWRDQLEALSEAPFDTSSNSLFVAYFASAEIGCFLALGWPLPARMLDLFTEFRTVTNGTNVIAGNGLIGALTQYGLPTLTAGEKDEMRNLILSGGPWSPEQQIAILEYCETDVRAVARLLPAMAATITSSAKRLGQALLRGRYMAAVARMEWCGVPIDKEMFQALRNNWSRLPTPLIQAVDQEFGVFDGQTFKADLFEAYLARNDIPWPRLESGKLALSDGVFRQQCKAHPKLTPLRELRHALSELRLNKLAVGKDGRNRTMLSPFQSKTGRNQPSNSKFIFGPSVWLRGLIKPAAGRAIAYLDWKSQEIAIAAALSGDDAMWAAYSTGDPYMAFAIQAGLAPPGATKGTHKGIRDRCKAIVLGVQYGMSAESMALNAGIHVAEARDLLLRHKGTFWRFWKWAEQNVNAALLGGTLYTRFGWSIRLGIGSDANTRSLLNWPMQSNGAEMMRLACCEATEAGLDICAPIHDALLLEASADEIEGKVQQLTIIMERASELVLGDGRVCGVDVDIVAYPDRYSDGRGVVMWDRVMGILATIDPG